MDSKKIERPSFFSNGPVVITIGFVLISSILKLSFLSTPFWGLEYEDAFVYGDVSRFLQHNYPWNIDPFQTKICTDGSISNCFSYATFSGHYMVLPILTSFFHTLFGYSINNIFIVNFIASILCLYLFIRTLNELGLHIFSSILACIILVTTPFLNLFNTSGLAETLSSLFVIGTFYYFLKSYKENFAFKKRASWIFILMLIVSFMTKRENLILVLLPVVSAFFLFLRKELNKQKFTRLLILFSLLLCLSLIYTYIAGINQMEVRESKDIGAATFSFRNFRIIFPQFIFSFLNIKYFGLTGLLFLFTSGYILFLTKKIEFKLALAFSWIYLIVYSAHYRSYSQVHFGQIHMFETLRYSTNFFPLACLCFGSIELPTQWIKKED